MPRTLTVTINGKDEQFTGEDKDACLSQLRARLEALPDPGAYTTAAENPLIGVRIDNGYKEHREIVSSYDQIQKYDETHALSTEWGIEIVENGVGDYRQIDARADVIEEFVSIAGEKGDHWD